MTNSLIADMISSMKNAIMRGKDSVKVRKSKMVSYILNVLKEDQFIESFSEQDRTISINLKYFKGYPVIRNFTMCSRPGRRVYCPVGGLKFARKKEFGILIISTNKGVMSDMQAVKHKVGGEIIARVN